MNLNESFTEAYKAAQAYEDKYIPLVAAFKEIKQILNDNFIVKKERTVSIENIVTKKYLKFFSRKVVEKTITKDEYIIPRFENLDYEKIKINDQAWLKIDDLSLIMSFGTIGERKDKLIFVPGYNVYEKDIGKYENIVFKYRHWDDAFKIFDGNKTMNEVKFFSYVIQHNKPHLKNKLT